MRQFVFTILTFVALFAGRAALAQNAWIQIEAHQSLAEAQARAGIYAGRIANIGGYVLRSGWYAIAVGPYSTADATVQLRALRAQGAIPQDSFLVDQGVYQQQFFPFGATSLTAPAEETPVIPSPLDPAGSDTSTGATETASAEPAAPAEPVEPPEETRAEALRSESQLDRNGRAELQIALQWYGFYTGRIDASFGRGTRGSMAAYQTSIGAEPTGVLTTRQRARLMADYQAVMASMGLDVVRDEVAGIEMVMPTAMVSFDRYEPPFAHYPTKGDSGVRMLLISQTGTESTLLGLFDIMQTLEIVPLEGERQQRRNEFELTGANDEIISYTYAKLDNGHVKGFTLIWPAGDEKRRDLALSQMKDSFTALPEAVLPDAYGDGALEQSIDLMSGLRIRRPDRQRSGFFVDGQGGVLTTVEAAQACERVTIDESYEARIVAQDDTLGLALLRPTEALSPMGFARFQPGIPRLQSEVLVAGYSYDGVLSAPTLTFGSLADLKGLNGETHVARLAVASSPSDAGGPVMDISGSVLGMLLPESDSGQRLPADVAFATDGAAIAEFLSNAGARPAASDGGAGLSAEELSVLAADMTVLVSCWN